MLSADTVHDNKACSQRATDATKVSPVLNEHLVELWRGDEEQDGGDGVKALEPLLTLRPLTSHVHEPEGNVVDRDDEFRDAFGGFACMQDVLVARLVLLHRQKSLLSELKLFPNSDKLILINY